MNLRNRSILLGLLALGPIAAACADGSNAAQDARPGDAAPVSVASTMDARDASLPKITVYKTPTCGCCGNWVEHMRQAGFEVETHDMNDLSGMKADLGVQPKHQSCHTATVGDYVVEGHVPADLIKKMLEEKPEIAGLAVPGMPRGSPGMEMPDGTKDDYDVIAFTADGSSSVYAHR
jgi:hypothetical protein